MDTSDDIFKDIYFFEPEDFIEKLLIVHPNSEWEIIDKHESAYVDDDVKDRLVGLVTADALIIDLFSSECGRFVVNPEEEYGVPLSVAEAIKKYNKF